MLHGVNKIGVILFTPWSILSFVVENISRFCISKFCNRTTLPLDFGAYTWIMVVLKNLTCSLTVIILR